ncbi:acylphosphatase [Agrococcus jejuensis]|uniref:acylphosphatase n=1 Tax=Agrococcus jejuensis TaxID=399736 RepID=A0A1G8G119_9MICO|nr:acylphosphatase [Agrococcus jejuensis]SDH87896.1 acylphosphatase [Agrococcus jejuensis]
MATRRRVTVHGSVQGVGFRWSAQQEAQRLGVAGSARNLVDGTVAAVVEGEADAVDAMVAWLRLGPPSARVSHVDVVDEAPRGATGFTIA